MLAVLSIIFLLGYYLIAREHYNEINKSLTAIFLSVILWTIIAVFKIPLAFNLTPEKAVGHLLPEISGILFFLIGAMTIVVTIEERNGFNIVKNWISSENQTKLIWIVTLITFFTSSILDNLTTTLLMIAVLKKIIEDYKDLLVFTVLIIVAANAGGAWSPIGDVTTTMLWIDGKITSGNIMSKVFLASLAQACFIPLLLTINPSLMNKLTGGKIEQKEDEKAHIGRTNHGSTTILITGVLALISVPIFKNLTNLPPWIGMMFAMSVVLIVNKLLNKRNPNEKEHILEKHLFFRVEWDSLVFFLGILFAVGAFQMIKIDSGNALTFMATGLKKVMNMETLGISLGIISAIVDNVPLVAACKGMFPEFTTDHWFWHFIAYTAGTGGSILVIGSAAGVVAMSQVNITFDWYAKKFAPRILLSYLVGAAVFLLQNYFFG